MRGAIMMRAELHAFIGDFQIVTHREDLIPAAVGESGFVPAVERCQPALRLDNVNTRAQVEMIGVTKDNFRTATFEVLGREGLYSSRRPYRHEGRRLKRPVRGRHLTTPRGTVGGVQFVDTIFHFFSTSP